MNKEHEILDLEKAIGEANAKIGWREPFFHEIATELYKAGYRKVYDDRFILKHDKSGYNFTEEEARFEEICKKCTLQVRKETAKEILNQISANIKNQLSQVQIDYSKAKTRFRSELDVLRHIVSAIENSLIMTKKLMVEYGVEIDK